tara:strand:- start:350 stop:814 length:465 start_codon:yes stop_codon:yes gene_type:complete
VVSIQNNFLTPDLYKEVENYCYQADYYYGEYDNPNQVPTGVVHDLKLDSKIVSYFPNKIKDLSLYRAYINLFNAGEKPNFHIDGEGLTSLFYINTENYNLDEGGCTEILTDKQYLVSVLPIRNSLVTFNAKLLHRATSFKSFPRFTVALKYKNP